jgi:CheY-like chemotaxis protein
MAEDLDILFCDDQPEKHDLFLVHVANRLKKEFKSYNFTFYHSQSLAEDYEDNYYGRCKDVGAKAVRTWLKEGKRFDLVITDMNYERGNVKMGTSETGLDIIREVHQYSQERSPWTRFILITAYPETAAVQRYVEVAEMLENEKESLITLSATESIVNMESVFARASLLVGKTVSDRQHYQKVQTQLTAPYLYDVTIISDEPSSEGIKVLVRQKGKSSREACIELKAHRYVFQALADPPKTFMKNGDLAREVIKLKRAEMGSEFAKLRRSEQIRILTVAGIRYSRNNSEFCDIENDDDFCRVARGSKVNGGEVGYQCQEVLDSLCIKKFYLKEDNAGSERGEKEERARVANAIRGQIKKIREEVSKQRVPLIPPYTEFDVIGRMHHDENEAPHLKGFICGYCLIFKLLGKQGYALTASVEWQ